MICLPIYNLKVRFTIQKYCFITINEWEKCKTVTNVSPSEMFPNGQTIFVFYHSLTPRTINVAVFDRRV